VKAAVWRENAVAASAGESNGEGVIVKARRNREAAASGKLGVAKIVAKSKSIWPQRKRGGNHHPAALAKAISSKSGVAAAVGGVGWPAIDEKLIMAASWRPGDSWR